MTNTKTGERSEITVLWDGDGRGREGGRREEGGGGEEGGRVGGGGREGNVTAVLLHTR